VLVWRRNRLSSAHVVAAHDGMTAMATLLAGTDRNVQLIVAERLGSIFRKRSTPCCETSGGRRGWLNDLCGRRWKDARYSRVGRPRLGEAVDVSSIGSRAVRCSPLTGLLHSLARKRDHPQWQRVRSLDNRLGTNVIRSFVRGMPVNMTLVLTASRGMRSRRVASRRTHVVARGA
jgi:hypothetical protein